MTTRTITTQLDVRSLDPEARTVKATLSTEAPVDRFGEQEVLVHDARSIDMTRAADGLPLLFSHDTRAPVGIVENIRIENRSLKGLLRFARNAKAQEVMQDVQDGVLRHLSIGYSVTDTQPTDTGYRAVKWTPLEASIVTVPADHQAQIGRNHAMTTETEIDTTDDTRLTRSQRRAIREQEEAEAAEIAAEERDARLAETREFRRLGQVTTTAIKAGVADRIPDFIARGLTIQQVRAECLDAMASRNVPHFGHVMTAEPTIEVRSGSGYLSQVRHVPSTENMREAITDGLLIRSGIRPKTVHRDAEHFAGCSLAEIAAQVTGERMTNTRDAGRVLKRALSSSVFPAILANVLGKSLRLGTESEGATHRRWCRVTDAASMRALRRPVLGSAPDLSEVLELGEYTHGVMADEDAVLTPVKYGKIVMLSWEAMLADDLGAFVRVGSSLGRAALRIEADTLYDRLTTAALAGQDLADTVALFDASRSNSVSVATGTGKPLTAAALGQARAKLRRQTAVGGGLLNLAPRHLLVPPEREHEAEVLVAASTIHTATAGAEAPGGWLTGLQVIAEPRLTNTDTVYLLASNGEIDTGEIAVVDNGPTVLENPEFTTDAMSWKVRHAFAAGFVDFRGLVKLTLTVS